MVEIRTFMDFCSGIGAGRLGLELNGLKCVGRSEISPSSDATYRLFFGQDEFNYGDLMRINLSSIPDFDVLIAGFPCQTFSIVGRRAGFNDERGHIIYGLLRILKRKKPICFILENVKGLLNHDSGKTLYTILTELKNVGYDVHHTILNSKDFGVPQLRERLYIIGFLSELGITEFSFPQRLDSGLCLSDVLEPSVQQLFNENNPTFQKYLSSKYNKGQYTFTDLVAEDYLIIDTRHSDMRFYKEVTPTLRTGRHGILYALKNRLWRLSGVEALKLQGFRPKQIKLIQEYPVVSNNTLLSQAGNAMTVNVIDAIAQNIRITLSQENFTRS